MSLSINSTSSSSSAHAIPDHHDDDPNSPLLLVSQTRPVYPVQAHRGNSADLTPAAIAEDPWWKKLWPLYQRQRPRQQSGLYTIVSMTDERLLRPRHTWARMAVSCLVVGLLVASVFFAVPRGVTVGSLRFVPHNWHKKSDHGTYTLQLGVSMPVYNNNWYPATISGKISVLFLDVVAGADTIHDFQVDARSQGQELHQCMDASGVPLDYALTIIQICMLYPRKLMFTTLADIRVATWISKTKLPSIDTYFMVDCFDQTVTEVEDPLGCGTVEPPAGSPTAIA